MIQQVDQQFPQQILHKYQIQKKIGQGSYGHVFKAIQLATDKPVAIKRIKVMNENQNNQQIQNLKRLNSLKTQNVIQYIQHLQLDGECFIIQRLFQIGSLDNFIKNNRKKLNQLFIFDVFKGVIDGMAYINAKGICHRDLSSKNILLYFDSGKYIPVISDFGTSTTKNKQNVNISQENLQLTQQKGTPLYMAPQVKLTNNYLQNCDVWSLGVILIQLFQAKYNNKQMNINLQIFWQQLKQGKQINVLRKFSTQLHPYWNYFINQLLCYNNLVRKNFQQLQKILKKVQKKMRNQIILLQNPIEHQRPLCQKNCKSYLKKTQTIQQIYLANLELKYTIFSEISSKQQSLQTFLSNNICRFMIKYIFFLCQLKLVIFVSQYIKNLKYKSVFEILKKFKIFKIFKIYPQVNYTKQQVALLLNDKQRHLKTYKQQENKKLLKYAQQLSSLVESNKQIQQFYLKIPNFYLLQLVKNKNMVAICKKSVQQAYKKLLQSQYTYQIKKLVNDKIKTPKRIVQINNIILLIGNIQVYFPDSQCVKKNFVFKKFQQYMQMNECLVM